MNSKSSSFSSAIRLLNESRISALYNCLEKLAPQARRTVDLFYQDEHKPKAIAQIMNWTPLAVSVALSRARKFLRECIQSQLGRKPA